MITDGKSEVQECSVEPSQQCQRGQAAGGAPAPHTSNTARLRFAIVGNGAISQELQRLAAPYEELCLLGVVLRGESPRTASQGARNSEHSSPDRNRNLTEGPIRVSLDQALAGADVIVEAAGGAWVRDHARTVLASGTRLLVASVGAFADPTLLRELCAVAQGNLMLTNGAIGGLDLLAAAGQSGGLDQITLRTTKHPFALIQEDTSPQQCALLSHISGATEVFRGTAAEAIAQFPASLNVAVAIGVATGLPDLLRVQLVADPEAQLTEHRIIASGTAGEYDFRIRNMPLADHPSSSGLTARSLLHGLRALVHSVPIFG